MKKQYVKPYLALESFQLVAAVAGACKDNNAQVVLGHSLETCKPEDELLFGGACGDYDMTETGICYQFFADPTQFAAS